MGKEAAKTIFDFLPKKEERERVAVHAKVPRSLFEKAEEVRAARGETWVEVIEAALMAYTQGGK